VRTIVLRLHSLIFGLLLLPIDCARAATLNGSYAQVPTGSVVDLTAGGVIDWVHWGFLTDNTIVRKAGVPPQIGPLTPVGFRVMQFRFFDNDNGYSWTDGWPIAAATNTKTGVWTYDTRRVDSGFELRLPADQTTRVAKLYVGVFAGVGRLSARIGTNLLEYSDRSLTNLANGPGRVYTLEYASDRAGDTLVVRWTLDITYDDVGNVTFQAAALTAVAANNPPTVSLTSPANNTSVAAPGTITLTAAAYDVDGQIEKVEFWDADAKLGEDFDAPYTYLWEDIALGLHVLRARAVDTLGGVRASSPVEIFAHGGRGRLTGTRSIPPAAVDLTTEGTLDWIHWGYSSGSSFNRKTAVEPQISNVVALGPGPFEQYANNYTTFSWEDGNPNADVRSTTTGIFITGWTNGFELRVPAATVLRRLKVYAGLYGAQGSFQAFLSDCSAPAYADTGALNVWGDSYNVYTLDFMAAEPGQFLTVRYRSMFLFDAVFGNVTLQAGTLQSVGPVVRDPGWCLDGVTFSFGTEPGRTYVVEVADSVISPVWSPVITIIGSGKVVSILDYVHSRQGFYRVRTEGSP
jgi:hypothetical protein